MSGSLRTRKMVSYHPFSITQEDSSGVDDFGTLDAWGGLCGSAGNYGVQGEGQAPLLPRIYRDK